MRARHAAGARGPVGSRLAVRPGFPCWAKRPSCGRSGFAALDSWVLPPVAARVAAGPGGAHVGEPGDWRGPVAPRRPAGGSGGCPLRSGRPASVRPSAQMRPGGWSIGLRAACGPPAVRARHPRRHMR
eukprot:3037682-Alexandrium_andersonii.AAC.1